MLEQEPAIGALPSLPPLRAVERVHTAPVHTQHGGRNRSTGRGRWIWAGVLTPLVLALAGGGAWVWVDTHQTNERLELAAVHAATYTQAASAYTAAYAEYEPVANAVAPYAPKLEATVARTGDYPTLFDEAALERFHAAVAAYAPNTELLRFTEPDELELEHINELYRAGGEQYDLATQEIPSDAEMLAGRAEDLQQNTQSLQELRAEVDAALVALAASALELAPEAEKRYASAPDDAKAKVATALDEVKSVADGTFPEGNRMPTAALYAYVNAVFAAEAAHEKAEQEAEAARKAAEEEAARVQLAAEQSRASSPTYTGGGSKEEWMSAAGISESDWGYVDYIVRKESSWNPNAMNSSSGACGLVQIMPLHTAAYANCTDPVANLRWADNYAKNRYGSWAGAYDFWTSNHWW